MPYNFAAESFHTKKLCIADFLQENCDFRGKRSFCVFEHLAVCPFTMIDATTFAFADTVTLVFAVLMINPNF